MRVERALTATVIAIVSPGSRLEAAETLSVLSDAAGVRPIIISLGDAAEPPHRDESGAMIIDGLVPRYLDNAVASLRLSSLPAVAWWRAGDPDVLRGLATLVDRVVLDLVDPLPAWSLVPEVATLAPVTDIRWARLTRWRDLIARFFDLPEARNSVWARLAIAGTDEHDARLLAGWLQSRLPDGRAIQVVHERRGAGALESVELTGAGGTMAVRLLPNGRCLETVSELRSGHAETRVVARGDEQLATLLGQELRVRSRDRAFEDAVRETERA